MPGLDNQFYLYFTGSPDLQIYMDDHEFTEARWVTPHEALQQYYKRELPLLLPQLMCVLHFSMIHSIEILHQLAREVFDSNLISYSSIAFEVRALNQLPEAMREKAVQYFVNEIDLKADVDRPGLTVIANPSYADLNKFLSGPKKDFATLARGYGDLIIGTLPGDFFDMNDGYPMLTMRDSRRRLFIRLDKGFWEMVRFEFT